VHTIDNYQLHFAEQRRYFDFTYLGKNAMTNAAMLSLLLDKVALPPPKNNKPSALDIA
jgi:hypothetical protein